MFVYVRNQDGAALMPCTPAKARKLLQTGKAQIIAHRPFTIQLTWQCEGHVQEVRAGIDKGSSTTGIACVGNSQVLLSAEIHHRRDVKEKMDDRRDRRKSRHARRWYRPARWKNRASSKRSDRLAPSIKTNVEEVIRVIGKVPLPISSIVIEDVQVDIARLNNPELQGSQYQDPTRLDENLRIACLMRDGYQCQQCGKQNIRLEAHHIVFKEHGGKDTLANLLTLCEICHHRLHKGEITLKVTGVSGHLDQIAERSMQGKSYLYATLGAHIALSKLFGYQTATLRKARGLSKTHIVDALCLATYHTGELVTEPESNIYSIRFRPRQTRKQFHSLPKRGKGRVRYQMYEELKGFKKGDIVLVKKMWVKQVNAIYAEGRLAFQRVKGEPANAKPEDCHLLEREQTLVWENVS
jgi:RRXRR protein/HNH endonuclease